MSVVNATPLLLGDDGYNISRSVRLRSSASAYFNRTPAGAGNRRTWTWSGWVKRGTLGVASRIFAADDGSASTDQDYNTLLFNSSNQLQFSGNLTDFRITTAVYRDPSAWYHIVFVVDTTQATAGNRFKLYVNGSEVTAFGTSNNPTQNTDLAVNAAIGHYIGSIAGASYVDAYLTEINFIDGQALTPSSFGETDVLTGVWKPKKYGGTYGTNGFYLNFSDNSNNTAATIGKDYSGNGNNWTPNNISVTSGVTYDSMLDVPTQWADGGNGRGNYCVLNPIALAGSTPTNGNLTIPAIAGTTYYNDQATMALPSSGQYYWETTWSTLNFATAGIVSASATWTSSSGTIYIGAGAADYSITELGFSDFRTYNNGTSTTTGVSVANNAVISIAFDASSNKIWFAINGTWVNSGSPSTGANPAYTVTSGNTYLPAFTVRGNQSQSVNFGQRPFAYTPPTGFKALNTQNLPAPTILKGNLYFDATLYTGNGASRSITNSGAMQPDLVWIKSRSNVTFHQVADSVRGATKQLYPNDTAAETSATDRVTAFNSDGFSLGADTNGGVNFNAYTYVAWQWKESATAGFDIVTQTLGTTGINTMSHSLGVAPRMILAKRRDSTEQWLVYHASATTQSQYLGLNTTAAVTSSANLWGSSSISSTQFFFSGTSGNQYVFYLFADVAGFSRFGSYTGNGSSDGPFVYLGFRPRYIMVKRSSAGTGTANWVVIDTARDTYNLAGQSLEPNLSDAEYTPASSGYPFDILSNGFKVRSTAVSQNEGGQTYIYAAFAENPFKNSLAR